MKDDLTAISNDLAELSAAVDKLVADSGTTTPSTSDTVVSDVVTALTNAGYTVTPPATTIDVTEAS